MAETSHTNRLAIVSLVLTLLTLFSFCIGVSPIPLTAGVCYPAAILLGAAALLSGWMSLRQIRRSGERGRWMALSGVILGGLTILAVLCAVALTISAFAAFLSQSFDQAKP